MGMIKVTKDITAEDSYTDVIRPPGNANAHDYGYLALSISGDFSATVTLQRSFDGGTTWKDVESFTAAIEDNIADFTEEIQYRAGVKTGDYTSGTASVILAK